MPSVCRLEEREPKKSRLDVSGWQGFAIAYIDEFGQYGCCVYANTLDEAKALLSEALTKLNVELL